jgi:MFS family permease
VGFTSAGGAMLLVAFLTLPYVAMLIIFAFAGFMVGLISPSRALLVRRISPPGASGRVFGFVSVGLDVGGVFAPLYFGWLLDIGAPIWVFLSSAVVMLIAVATAIAAARFAPEPMKGTAETMA